MKQIEASTNERYTKVLRQALEEIEQKIASLQRS
jgi:DNA-directed RNA polymerase subunit K/omega